LKSVKGLVNEKKAFGSSHFIDFIQFSRKRGPWYVPEEIAKGSKSCGYEQIGIDLRKRYLDGATKSKLITPESCQNIGVYLLRRHLLSGKLPLKSTNQKKQFTFVKLETYGTKRVSSAVGHSISFLKTRKDVGRPSPSNSRTSPSNSNVSEGEHGAPLLEVNDTAVVKRKEHTPMNMIYLFTEIMHLVHGDDTTEVHSTVQLYASPLTRLELLAKRPKILGLSFMHSIIQDVKRSLSTKKGQSEYDLFPKQLFNKLSEWDNLIVSNGWLDHIDVRFGQEVILGHDELQQFATTFDSSSNKYTTQCVSYNNVNCWMFVLGILTILFSCGVYYYMYFFHQTPQNKNNDSYRKMFYEMFPVSL